MDDRLTSLYCCMAEHAGTHARGGGRERRDRPKRGRRAQPRWCAEPIPRRGANHSSEAHVARAGKSRYGPCSTRTADRHRWAGGGPQGRREKHRQGTRQNGPVTSGEGAPAMSRPQGRGPSNCLAKTQAYAKPEGEVYGLTPARCWKVKGRGQETKPRAQAPVNGGRNYNGPKVAKFLVG